MIEVRNLTKRYGAVAAVDDLSFDVTPGHVTGFLGPNGAGKTTTLRMALGLARPDQGQVTIEGRPFSEIPNPGTTVGAILESGGFHPGRSGRNHLRALTTTMGLPESRADEVLSSVALTDAARRRVKGYSLGMRQRLGVAAALLGKPRVLILDEPANGLDPAGIRWLRELLHWFAGEGGTVLVSSHLLTEVAQLATDVVIIAKGRLVTQSPVEELLRRAPGSGVLVRSPQADALEHELEGDGRKAVRTGPDTVSVPGVTTELVGELAASKGLILHELRAVSVGLEDVFLGLTAGADGPAHAAGDTPPTREDP